MGKAFGNAKKKPKKRWIDSEIKIEAEITTEHVHIKHSVTIMRVFIITLNPWIMFIFCPYSSLILWDIITTSTTTKNIPFRNETPKKKCLFNKFSSATVSLCIYSIGLNVSFSCVLDFLGLNVNIYIHVFMLDICET